MPIGIIAFKLPSPMPWGGAGAGVSKIEIREIPALLKCWNMNST